MVCWCRPVTTQRWLGHSTGLIKNPEKARRLGAKGRLLSHEYSLEAMIDKIDTLYTEMLESVDRGRRDR